MISGNIKQLIIDGIDFNVNIAVHIESKKIENNTELLYSLNETCAKIKKYIKDLNTTNGIKISIKSIKAMPVKDDNMTNKPFPKHPWRRKGLIYQVIDGLADIRYTTIEDHAIVEYNNSHFKIPWCEVQKLSLLPDKELHRNKLNVRLNSKGISGLLIFIDAIRKGKVEIPEVVEQKVEIPEVVEQKVEIPEVVEQKVEIPLNEWKNIRSVAVKGDPYFTYRTKINKVLISRENINVLSDWDNIIRFSQYDTNSIFKKVLNHGYTDEESRLITEFVIAYIENRVIDPDAEFRPMLSTETTTRYDGNKIEGTLEE